MEEWFASIAALAGCLFMLLSGVGILRMNDVYLRSQTASLAPTFGKIGIMLAIAAHFEEGSVTAKALLVVVFLFLTAPIAAHLILRAAYHDKAPLCPNTVKDDYQKI